MKDIEKTIVARHSVRRYHDKPIDDKLVKELEKLIDNCNKISGLNIQLILNDSETFDKYKLHYGQIYGCKNYIALIGKKNRLLDETVGYYGEKIVLEAQEMGLNTCWVAGGYRRGLVNAKINPGERLVCIIAIGYGLYQGRKPKGKEYSDITNAKEAPQWYKKGIEYALLAPSAMNQQKFKFELLDNSIVRLKAGIGPMVKIDMGIAKYHFELGAGTTNFKWKK